jgi:OOP family OmpA-OmpF porin
VTGSGTVSLASPGEAQADVSESGARAASADTPAAKPYMERYVPEPNLWEFGLFGGVFFPSDDHNLKVPTLPQEPYAAAAFELGMRVGYYPVAFLGIEAEAAAMPTTTRDTERTAMLYTARGHLIAQLPYWSVVPFVVGGGGLLGGISRSMGNDSDPLVYFGAGVKVPMSEHLSARLDLRDNLTQKLDSSDGTATHNFEALLGLTITLGRSEPQVSVTTPVGDADRDGRPDDEDSCPDRPALTSDGCPTDRDGDRVLDGVDECPTEVGDSVTGCPNKDIDADKVPIPCDQCPYEAGPAPTGCPTKDKDGDGFPDSTDKCPTEAETRNGFEDSDGCPDEVPEAVKRFSGVIQGITFQQGKAVIRPESYKTLDAAVEVLKTYPDIRLEISGHTSSEGNDKKNLDLSLARAEAVKKYMVDKGIDSGRIEARGAGSAEPLDDNATVAGRERNRRIQFKILSQN